MTETEALDLLDEASKGAQGDREFHIKIIEAIKLLRALIS